MILFEVLQNLSDPPPPLIITATELASVFEAEIHHALGLLKMNLRGILIVVRVKFEKKTTKISPYQYPFRDTTSQKILSGNERVIAIRYLPPGIKQNSRKSLLSLKTSFSAQNYTLPAFSWFSIETKQIICSIFLNISF